MAGVTDFRVASDFSRHPKVMKLRRRLGAAGVLALVELWGWAAANKPGGDLVGMDKEDIELASGWTGEPGQLVPVLVELRLLDLALEQLSLHDWQEHNGWAAGAPARSAQARAAAAARWNSKATSKAGSMQPALLHHAQGNAPSPSPSPSSTPPPGEEIEDYCRLGQLRGVVDNPAGLARHLQKKRGLSPAQKADLQKWKGEEKTGGIRLIEGMIIQDTRTGQQHEINETLCIYPDPDQQASEPAGSILAGIQAGRYLIVDHKTQ